MGGPGSIPFDAVDRYAARMGVDDFEEFWMLIRHLDGVYLDEMHRRKDAGGK